MSTDPRSTGPVPPPRSAPSGAEPYGTRTARVAPGPLLDFLRGRTTGPAAQEPGRLGVGWARLVDVEDLHDADVDAAFHERLQELYAGALPARVAAISRGSAAGDPGALAAAATTLAGASGQLGHLEVAAACRAIARDARRGVLAHGEVARLRAVVLAAAADPTQADTTTDGTPC